MVTHCYVHKWLIHSHNCTCLLLLGWWYPNLSLRPLSWAPDTQLHVDILWEHQMKVFIFLLSRSAQIPRFSHSAVLFPVTGSKALSHLSVFHFLHHCAVLSGCQVSAIPFSEYLVHFHVNWRSHIFLFPRKLSHPLSSGNWAGIWPRHGYSWCLWQTDAKVTRHGLHFLGLMPLCVLLSLSVGGTYDLLLPNRLWQKAMSCHSHVYIVLYKTCLARRLAVEILLAGLMSKWPCWGSPVTGNCGWPLGA